MCARSTGVERHWQVASRHRIQVVGGSFDDCKNQLAVDLEAGRASVASFASADTAHAPCSSGFMFERWEGGTEEASAIISVEASPKPHRGPSARSALSVHSLARVERHTAMLRCSLFRQLPQRALAQTKKKAKKGLQKKTAQAAEIRLAPHIPLELVKETRQFFNNTPRFRALLELVFSPREPQDTEEDRAEYEVARAEFETLAEKARQAYSAHEQRAETRMWRAIRQLPEDLHDEAVASKPESVPEPLLFHARHRTEIFNNLSPDEQRKLQVFQNLMYVRYPHSEEKQRNPDRFWIPENQVVSRQKEAALQKRRIKGR